MYYIIKITDNWTIFENATRSTRILKEQEITVLKGLFPEFLNDTGSFLQAVEVISAPVNKLSKISLTPITAAPRKLPDTTKPPAA